MDPVRVPTKDRILFSDLGDTDAPLAYSGVDSSPARPSRSVTASPAPAGLAASGGDEETRPPLVAMTSSVKLATSPPTSAFSSTSSTLSNGSAALDANNTHINHCNNSTTTATATTNAQQQSVSVSSSASSSTSPSHPNGTFQLISVSEAPVVVEPPLQGKCEHWTDPEPSVEPVTRELMGMTAEEFVQKFIDDEGAFWNEYHSETGRGGERNTWIKPYPKTTNKCCYSRDFTFQQPIPKTSFLSIAAPSSTKVTQVHRWFFPNDEEVRVTTISNMVDVPNGSSFAIKTSWVVRQVANGCLAKVYVEGLFYRWMMGLKGTVESMIKRDGTEYVVGLLDKMQRYCEKKAISAAAAATPKKLPEPAIAANATASASAAAAEALARAAKKGIRHTPPRLTPPPKKKRDQPGGVSWMQTVIIFALVAMILLTVYNAYYVRSLRSFMQLYGGSGGGLQQSVLDAAKQEVRMLKERLNALEQLLEKLN